MTPILLVMQGVVLVGAVQTLALLVGVAWLVHWTRAREAERRDRDRALRIALAAEIAELKTLVRASRAETATYLEAVFTGVRALLRDEDEPPGDEKRHEVVHLRDLAPRGRRPGSSG